MELQDTQLVWGLRVGHMHTCVWSVCKQRRHRGLSLPQAKQTSTNRPGEPRGVVECGLPSAHHAAAGGATGSSLRDSDRAVLRSRVVGKHHHMRASHGGVLTSSLAPDMLVESQLPLYQEGSEGRSFSKADFVPL